MRTLPYTKLVTPENLTTAGATREPDGSVVARLVDLRDHHRQVAVVVVDAHGLVRLDAPRGQQSRLKQFAGRCRDADGRRLHRTIVWQMLAMEPLYARAVAEAEQTAGEKVAVRVVRYSGAVTLHQVDAPGPDMGIHLNVRRTVASVEAWLEGQWSPVEPLPLRIQLPHTGVWVPRAYPVEVGLEQVDFDATERTWSMFVWIDGQPVGRAGRRGEYLTFTEHKPGALKVLDQFTRVCLGPQGESVANREEFLETLFAEHHIATAVRKAVGQGEHLVQAHTPDGVDLIQLPDRGAPGEPDYDQARADALRMLPPDAVGAELWTEHGWVPLPLSY